MEIGSPGTIVSCFVFRNDPRGLETFSAFRHHGLMFLRWTAFILLFSSLSFAGIVEDVQNALMGGNFELAESELQDYHAHHSPDPEYLEALSWMARAQLMAKQLGAAQTYATQTENMTLQLLQKRSLDAEPHLPLALGAALEVKAQVLEARGQHAQAVALLKRSIATYSATSIKPRLQKNLNLLTLAGTAAPALHEADYLGSKPAPLAQLKGMPVLLFFWAHWCLDCKAEGPIIAQLRSEFGPKGLAVYAPTQLYGYAARGQDATPQAERSYIEQVWKQYYPALQGVPVPISKENFSNYGASTTPTLVVLNREGKVALYHPGVMPYNDLRNAIQQAVGN